MRNRAIELMRSNSKRLGNLTDEEFLAVKSRVCNRKLIHAERIGEIQRIGSFGFVEDISLSDIKVGDSVKIRATVRSMVGGAEKTGWVVLDRIQDVHKDESIGMLILDTEKYIFTTLECKSEMYVLEAVINGDNWVDLYELGTMITPNSFLCDYQEIMAQSIEQGIKQETHDFSDFPELLF